MRIIKPGVIPEEKLYICICFRCKCEFEFQRKEAKIYSDQREGTYLNINCPTCGYLCSKGI